MTRNARILLMQEQDRHNNAGPSNPDRKRFLIALGSLGAAGATTLALWRAGLLDFVQRLETDGRRVEITRIPEEVKSREIVIPGVDDMYTSRRLVIDVASGKYTDEDYYSGEPNPPTTDLSIPQVIEATNQEIRQVNHLVDSDRQTKTAEIIVENRDYVYSFINPYSRGEIVFHVPQDMPVSLRLYEWQSFQLALYNAVGNDDLIYENSSEHLKRLREDWDSKRGRYLGPWSRYEHDGEEIATKIGALSNVVDASRYMDL
ncbi:MAG: hypothetical protein UU34_C0008G0037 [Candidatus Curtissbacteria bacterium GW2011_GWA1_41_11]|uniref:Uncharacterized protein n=1 Tax=Candidatus Curtissbacteria bacterium GW2011_GWA1_41_11 TaxID=1618409 RepID=A0A0G0UDI4_9BACT|nr:MAG: hypothetical protein UU34_C0008G0037 [Candidatus Curtissbacteria bacterium GW2011_GWA1_41_11]